MLPNGSGPLFFARVERDIDKLLLLFDRNCAMIFYNKNKERHTGCVGEGMEIR